MREVHRKIDTASKERGMEIRAKNGCKRKMSERGLQVAPHTECVTETGANNCWTETLECDRSLEICCSKASPHSRPIYWACSKISSVTLANMEVSTAQMHLTYKENHESLLLFVLLYTHDPQQHIHTNISATLHRNSPRLLFRVWSTILSSSCVKSSSSLCCNQQILVNFQAGSRKQEG